MLSYSRGKFAAADSYERACMTTDACGVVYHMGVMPSLGVRVYRVVTRGRRKFSLPWARAYYAHDGA